MTQPLSQNQHDSSSNMPTDNAETQGYLSVADYDYDLPDEYIARYPLAERSASR